MTEKTKPNFLKVVDVTAVTVPPSELSFSRLRLLAAMEIEALNKRLAKRKTSTLTPYEKAAVTFITSINAPTATDDDKLNAGEVFRQTLIDSGSVIIYRDQYRGDNPWPRKNEYRIVNRRYRHITKQDPF
jgi:hypothetical protein